MEEVLSSFLLWNGNKKQVVDNSELLAVIKEGEKLVNKTMPEDYIEIYTEIIKENSN